MWHILFLIFFILNQTLCKKINYVMEDEISDKENKEDISLEYDSETIDPGIAHTYYFLYHKSTYVNFTITDNESIQVNIHAINCNFELKFNGTMMKQFNLNSYSFIISSENNPIIITPLLDVIDGQYKENYAKKTCPLSINSYVLNTDLSETELKIENNEESYFYLVPEKYNLLKLSYEIKEISEESYVGLFFQYNEKSKFEINYIYENIQNSESKNISNSTIMYLNSSFLLYDKSKEINNGGKLSINIINLDEKEILMKFKIIEKDSISLLQKDALNPGFVTSKTTYQYFYTQVFEGEEGELMLHKKRTYGLLYGNIVDKSNISDLYNASLYPNKNTDNTTILTYNYHTLKLNFSYLNTSHCQDGCYLLVTFEQIKEEEGDFPLIGYEFSILTRFWNYSDYISNIVDIPFNEYLIGSFEMGSITHHYYSLFIPEDAHIMIIQIECNYLDGYMGEGRLRLNTAKQIGNTKKLMIDSEQNVLSYNVKSEGLAGKIISFAFRPIDYFDDIFSYYYFRVLYSKENETIYYPMDSNLGNLCIPERNKDNDNDKNYYCYFIFYNYYNELSRGLSISSTIFNEYYRINYIKVFNNNNIEENSNKFLYIDEDSNEDINYYIFKFQFRNGGKKNIISSVIDYVTDLYPQIYSYQMYFTKSYKTNHFNMISNYTFYHQYIDGYAGTVYINFLKYENFASTRNFRGKPLSVTISSETDTIKCATNDNSRKYFAYFINLQYNMKNKVVEEIKSGEVYSQFIIGRYFPLHYYLKVKDKNYINIDINLRINSYNETALRNNFQIIGYVLDEKTIQRKINGEYIPLNAPINGYYLDTFKIGLLQINQKINNNENYILIEIRNGDKDYIDYYLLVELITKENNDKEYFLPINLYILETFDGKNNEIITENKYYLSSDDKGTDQVLIDFSSAYDDIDISFDDSVTSVTNASLTGFKKYRVYNSIDNDVYFKVINKRKIPNANYMIRYYYTGAESVFNYSLNDSQKIMHKPELDQDTANITITYNPIKITTNYIPVRTKKNGIKFYIYAFLFIKDNKTDEQINTTSILTKRKYLFKTNILYHFNFSNPEKFNITFDFIPRQFADVYELQLQVNAIHPNNIFNEEFLIFTSEIDLTGIGYISPKEEEKNKTGWIIGGVIGGVIVIGLVVFFILKYKKLQKSNTNLQEDLKSLAFSNDVQKNVLIKERRNSKKDADYESTFI